MSSDQDKDQKIIREYNHVYFYSPVSRNSVHALGILLREAEEYCFLTSFRLHIPEFPIYLHISSLGGSVYDALQARDEIHTLRVPVHTVVEGATASAATLISLAGARKYIRPSAYMLIHQLRSGAWGGTMSQGEDHLKNLRALTERLVSIYKHETQLPSKTLSNILKHDLWWNSERCLECGLIDEVWE